MAEEEAKSAMAGYHDLVVRGRSRYGTYSQVVLGLEPDFPLATFGPMAEGGSDSA